MKKPAKLLLASLGITSLFSFVASNAVYAQGDAVVGQRTTIIESTTTGTTGPGSSETTVETRGVGFKGANVFNPKYKERIGTYTEQINMGEQKGWLTAAEVQDFKTRLEGLKKLEADAAAKGWVKADVDHVDKVFTKFNMDFTAAANKSTSAGSGSAPKTTPQATSTAKPAGTVAGGDTKAAPKSTNTKAKTTTKTTAKKPAAKPKSAK